MRKIFYLVLSVFLLMAPAVSYAQIVPCDGINTKCEVNHIFKLLTNIYNFMLGLAALVAMLMIVWAGVQMLIYHFNEQPQQALEAAKNTLTRAIFGLVIIIIAYAVVNTLLTLVLGIEGTVVTDIFSGKAFQTE